MRIQKLCQGQEPRMMISLMLLQPYFSYSFILIRQKYLLPSKQSLFLFWNYEIFSSFIFSLFHNVYISKKIIGGWGGNTLHSSKYEIRNTLVLSHSSFWRKTIDPCLITSGKSNPKCTKRCIQNKPYILRWSNWNHWSWGRNKCESYCQGNLNMSPFRNQWIAIWFSLLSSLRIISIPRGTWLPRCKKK